MKNKWIIKLYTQKATFPHLSTPPRRGSVPSIARGMIFYPDLYGDRAFMTLVTEIGR